MWLSSRPVLASADETIPALGKQAIKTSFAMIRKESHNIVRGVFSNDYCRGAFVTVGNHPERTKP